MNILVVGSVAIDAVKTPFGSRTQALGGSATYFSMAASLFNRVNIVATVGKDFPQRYIELFRSRGIGIKGLVSAAGKTFRWKGSYGYDLDVAHTIYTHLNVFKDFRPEIPPPLRNSEIVFLANIDPELQYGVLRQMKRPRLVACDTMNYWIDNKRRHLERLLRHVDIFLLNNAEARQLSGEANLMRAARRLVAMGPKAVVIKKGEHGVVFFSRKAHFVAPAYLLEQIYDPTGAGDTFAGGMIGYLSTCRCIDEASIRRSVVYGTILASFAVEDFSVDRLIRISMRDVKKRFAYFEKVTKF